MNQITGFEIENGVMLKYTGRSDEVVVPDGVTTIGSYAFKNKYKVRSIVIPQSVTSIADHAFIGCSALE